MDELLTKGGKEGEMSNNTDPLDDKIIKDFYHKSDSAGNHLLKLLTK